MNDNENLWPIRELFELEVLTLATARDKTQLIHHLKNIRSAGDEVEEALRDFFRRRLARRCCIGHGHVVDQKGHVSPQIDMVIHDGLDFPSLQENRDGTEYFPFESVYAIAEFKSTYSKAKEPIAKFSKMIKEVFKGKLSRQATPIGFVPTGFGTGINLGQALNSSSIKQSYLNPLFAFMIFVDSGDFQIKDIENFYQNTDRRFLPNMLVFLDRGIVMLNKHPQLSVEQYECVLFPEFHIDQDYVWCFLPISPRETLALTWSVLADALTKIILLKPQYLNYIARVFELDDKGIELFGSSNQKT